MPIYLALGVIWGCSFLFIKLGLEFLSPIGVAFFRCALGAITLFVYSRVRSIQLPRSGSTWLKLWVMALLLNVVPGFLFALAEQHVTSILAGIINATTPLMTICAMLIFFRDEKLTSSQAIGLFIGAVGVLTVLGVWNGVGENALWSVMALILAVACYGFTFPFARRYVMPLRLQPEALAATQLLGAVFTLAPIYLIDLFVSKPRFELITLSSLLGILALGVLGSGFAYIWNFRIIESAGSAIASSVTYLTPVVAVLIGWLFYSESISWNEPLGGLLVLFGAALSQGRLALVSRTKAEKGRIVGGK